MDKEELKQKIALMEEEIAKLKEQIGLTENDKIWQPEKYEEYWTIKTDGEVSETYNNNNSDCDKRIVECCNYFKTLEEAEKQAEYNRVVNRFRKYVGAHSEPLDWNNKTQHKYSILLRTHNKAIEFFVTHEFEDAFQIYASSQQVLKDAIIYSAGSEEEFIRIVFGENDE